MSSILYKKFFTPVFLKNSSFGVDISDTSLKFIELKKEGNPRHGGVKNIVLGKYGVKKIPAGVIEMGEVKNKTELVNILKTFKKETKVNSIKTTILDDSILKAFKEAGIKITGTEKKSEAIKKCVLKEDDFSNYMVVDFGEMDSDIFIVNNKFIEFSTKSAIGGFFLTTMIKKKFGITFSDAEKIKMIHGLKNDEENRQLYTTLIEGVSILRDELNRYFVSWHLVKDPARNAFGIADAGGGKGRQNQKIEKIILCGGSANLIGLVDYLKTSLRIEVELANVWENVGNFNEHLPAISFKNSLTYATVIGLALEGIK
ncbi:MAG: pilus assembly protein PilM [Candidatus Paceibacterota bacterium]|jgi:Tfp pilus assembly PilM family ATPase